MQKCLGAWRVMPRQAPCRLVIISSLTFKVMCSSHWNRNWSVGRSLKVSVASGWITIRQRVDIVMFATRDKELYINVRLHPVSSSDKISTCNWLKINCAHRLKHIFASSARRTKNLKCLLHEAEEFFKSCFSFCFCFRASLEAEAESEARKACFRFNSNSTTRARVECMRDSPKNQFTQFRDQSVFCLSMQTLDAEDKKLDEN
jgi:hypothetical protein